MTIYTRRGDRGETGLLGGMRVWKNSPRLDVIGTLDELNSTLGLIRAERLPEEIDRILGRLQNELFTPAPNWPRSLRPNRPARGSRTSMSWPWKQT